MPFLIPLLVFLPEDSDFAWGWFAVSLLLLIVLVGFIFRNLHLKRGWQEAQAEVAQLKGHAIEFVANVSHELKTPLTSIMGYTETLKGLIERDPAKAKDFLKKIEENSQRLSLLINDILELSRIEHPNFYLDREVFPLEPLLQEIRDRFHDKMTQRKQVFSVKQEVAELFADRWLLDQALSNLIENAHRYCPEGAMIELVVQAVTEGGKNYTQIMVADNGPGLKSEDLPRIFERFYRVDKARTRQSGGTGLGLAIAKHIMLSHGGLIRAASQPGEGAKFTLLFPRS